jgi:Tfp pilus assembly protein PilO
MSEIALSYNLQQIEFEIDYHKQVAGQSFWEIGRRLKQVKENDLTHGKFIDWIEKRGIHQREAQRMMKVAEELPNTTTLSHLGSTALYLIATLPEEEREKEHQTSKGELKTPDQMTVREIQELKKQIQQKDKQIANLTDVIDEMAEMESEVIEKKVYPPDYEGLKSDNQLLSGALKEEQNRRQEEIKLVKQETEEIIENLKRENNSLKTIKKAEDADVEQKQKQLRRLQLDAEISVYTLINKLIRFSTDQYLTNEDVGSIASVSEKTKEDLSNAIERIEDYLDEIKQAIAGKIIV